MTSAAPDTATRPRLAREIGLLGLVATGVCSMVGAGINVIPFMIQRNVPGIGPLVLPAYALAALPAVLAGLAYAILASAMPRAGGSYVYASRGLSPYLGFVASFSQWFSLCVAIGVVSYVLVPFLRDIFVAVQWASVASTLEAGPVRLTISLAVLWTAVGINVRGVRLYERLVVPLMFLTFILGGVVIVAGFAFDHGDFAAAVAAREGRAIPESQAAAGARERFFLPRPCSSRRSSASTRSRRPGARRKIQAATCRWRSESRWFRSGSSTCSSPPRCITPCRGSTSRRKPSVAT